MIASVALPPAWLAGVLLLGRTIGQERGLACESVDAIVMATGASKSRAYEVAGELAEVLPALVRTPGRPAKQQTAASPDETAQVARTVLAYVMKHPGCVDQGAERQRYADGFRRFVIELRAQHTGLEIESFADAACVPHGGYRLSRRQVAGLLSDVLGVRISLGAVSEAEERVSDAIAPAVDEALQFVRAQPIKHVDATGWSHGGLPRGLWTISTALVTVFAITEDATRNAIKSLLVRMRGILVSDRASVFVNFWAMTRRQICWAHLMRKFAGVAERRGMGRQIARDLHGTTELIFHYWHRVRDGTITRSQFREWIGPVRQRVEWLLERGAALNGRGFSGVCRNHSRTS